MSDPFNSPWNAFRRDLSIKVFQLARWIAPPSSRALFEAQGALAGAIVEALNQDPPCLEGLCCLQWEFGPSSDPDGVRLPRVVASFNISGRVHHDPVHKTISIIPPKEDDPEQHHPDCSCRECEAREDVLQRAVRDGYAERQI